MVPFAHRHRNAWLAAVGLLLTACAAQPTVTPTVALEPGMPTAPVAPRIALAEPPVSVADAAAYAQIAQQQEHQARALCEALSTPAPHRTDAALLADIDAFARVVDGALSNAGLLRNVHPNEAVREAANRCEQAISQIVTDVNLSRPLYEAVAAIDLAPLDAATTRLVKHMLRDFRRAGVDRSEAERGAIRRLKDELVQVGQKFDQFIREDTRRVPLKQSALAGLPDDYLEAHPADKKGQVTITTDYPDYVPFMTYAHDDSARKALYMAFRQRGAPKNEAVLKELLRKRHELAQALGYASWADYITEDKMIGSADEAQRFIDKVAELSVARSHQDISQLLFVARSLQTRAQQEEAAHGKHKASGNTPAAATHAPASAATLGKPIERVEDWQKAYLEEQERRQRYQLDAQAVRAFFPFGKVRDGLLATCEKLFGVTFRKIERAAWHEDVVAYELLEKGEVRGTFFLDLHPRKDKYKHAAAFPIRAGTVGPDGTVLPVAALVCNFPAGEDALLEHDDVTTFFHEFGHLLHHLFAGQQRWVGQSGIATEWDFVEAPSQMLEEWSFDKSTLQGFAVRQDGAVIDDETVAAMRQARALGRGLWVRQQMFYAALSLAYHRLRPDDPMLRNTDLLVQQMQAKYAPFAYVPGSHFQLSFGHLEGYSAMYYTYMWSLSIAKDMLGEFARAGSLYDLDVARRYRETVLAPGGSDDAAALVHNFLHRDFRFEAFAQWVNAPD